MKAGLGPFWDPWELINTRELFFIIIFHAYVGKEVKVRPRKFLETLLKDQKCLMGETKWVPFVCVKISGICSQILCIALRKNTATAAEMSNGCSLFF